MFKRCPNRPKSYGTVQQYPPVLKLKAYELFMTEKLTGRQVAEKLSIPFETIKAWMRKEHWTAMRISLYQQGKTKFNQQILKNREHSANQASIQLDAGDVAGLKILKKMAATDDIDELAKLIKMNKDLHAVTKTHIILPEPRQRQNANALPINPIQFNFNVQPIGKSRQREPINITPELPDFPSS